jgi:hypothetical protein
MLRGEFAAEEVAETLVKLGIPGSALIKNTGRLSLPSTRTRAPGSVMKASMKELDAVEAGPGTIVSSRFSEILKTAIASAAALAAASVWLLSIRDAPFTAPASKALCKRPLDR